MSLESSAVVHAAPLDIVSGETERKGVGRVLRELEVEVEAHSMVPAVLERNEI